jgi:Zn-dependent protease with chaperone function
MMTLGVLLPLAAMAVALGLTAGVRPWLAPAAAARLLTLVAVSSALTVGWALLLIAFGWAITYPSVDNVAAWCMVATPGHHPVGTVLGFAALATLLVGTIRAVAAAVRFWRTDAAWRGSDPVEIIASSEPIAFAVPGRRGTVVVSTGLLGGLPRGQRDALLAHEHAHVRLHHHRYVRATRLAASIVPVLYPLEQWVTLATERWADEAAAATVGDRRIVADALVAAASMQVTRGDLLFASASHVEERVGALLAPRTDRRGLARAAFVAAWASLAVSLVSSIVELHHLVAFVQHICTGN